MLEHLLSLFWYYMHDVYACPDLQNFVNNNKRKVIFAAFKLLPQWVKKERKRENRF